MHKALAPEISIWPAVIPFATDDNGDELITFAFAPA
jgi:hypothetical protein